MKVLHEKNNTLSFSTIDRIIKGIADQYYAPRKANVEIKQGPTMSTLTHKVTHLKSQSFWLHRAKYCVPYIHFFQILFCSFYADILQKKIIGRYFFCQRKSTCCFTNKLKAYTVSNVDTACPPPKVERQIQKFAP